MSKYIDLHNHILPGIDDGPLTMNESVLLARQLVHVGFDTVAVTPHAFEGNPAPEVIIECLQELQDELNRQEIPLKLLPGAEQHIDPFILERLKNGEILTLNNSRYLLLELPMLQPLPVYAEQLIFNLNQEGYQPIIAHPERVVELYQDSSLLYDLYTAGAYFQVTWSALVGWLGQTVQQAARTMLDANLVHLLATDAHSPAARLHAVDKAAAYLEQRQGNGIVELMLTTRPRQVLDDQPLELPEPLAIDPQSTFPFFTKFLKNIL